VKLISIEYLQDDLGPFKAEFLDEEFIGGNNTKDKFHFTNRTFCWAIAVIFISKYVDLVKK